MFTVYVLVWGGFSTGALVMALVWVRQANRQQDVFVAALTAVGKAPSVVQVAVGAPEDRKTKGRVIEAAWRPQPALWDGRRTARLMPGVRGRLTEGRQS